MSGQRAEWIDALGREHVLVVASALGLEVQKPRGASGGSCSCPACGAERRHPSRQDRRLAVGVRSDGLGWRCYQCDASGDQLHLAALALERGKWGELTADQKTRVRTWAVDWLRLASTSLSDLRDSAMRPGVAEPTFPPSDEVADLWSRCGPVTGDPRVCTWLTVDRGLDAPTVAQLDLARALPRGADCPLWASKKIEERHVGWSQTAYRAIFRLYDHLGLVRSVLARYCGTPAHPRTPKSRAPLGFARRGLVLADPRGRAMLAGERVGERVRVVIAEGEMDHLAWATSARASSDDETVCVLGLVSGSWLPEIAARVPDGATVLVATHADKDGEKYAREITATLAARMQSGAVRAERWVAR